MGTTPQIQVGATTGGNPPVGYAQGVSNPPNGGAVTSVDSPAPMVPMISPDGRSGDIPSNRVQDAIKAGFKQALAMTAPDGKTTGYVPVDKALDAQNAGFKMANGVKIAGLNGAGQPIFGPQEQPSGASLYADALFNPVGSGAASGVSGALEQAGGRAMQGITAPLLHPIDTLSGIAHAIAHPIDTAEQRINEFKQEWKQNPALAMENAAGDVAGLVEGGRVGSAALAKAADVAAPLAGRAVLLGKTPEGAYESALKPSPSIGAADRADLVQTGLEKGIPISKGGVEKIGDLIDDLNQKIKATIARDPRRPIDPNAVARRAGDVVPKFESQVNSSGDLAAINASRAQFLAEQGAKPGTPAIPPQPTGLVDAQGRPIMNAGTPAKPPTPAPAMNAIDAQAMKEGTYRVLRGKYGEQGSAAVEAQKALARGLKEEISNQFPEINKLNADESRLLDLQPILERAVNRISNHQLVGIGTPIAGTAVKAVTGSGSAGMVASALKAVLDNPAVKSRLAIAVSKGAKIPYARALSRVAAYSAAIGSYAESSPSNYQGAP